MIETETKSTIFKKIFENNALFQLVLQFLDSKSIATFALINQQTRFRLGSIIQAVINTQRIFNQQQISFNYQISSVILPFEKTIKSIIKSLGEQSYRRIVQSIKVGNIKYFEQFFKSVLNESINLKPDRLAKQKLGLIQIGENVKKSLNQIIETNRIPKMELNHTEIASFSKSLIPLSGTKSKLELQIAQFMEHLLQLKNSNYSDKDYKSYSKIIKYLDKTRIRQPKYDVYKSKIYYFNFKNSLYNYLNHNIASHILQFLTHKELLEVRYVSKWFCFQIPVLMPTIINQIENQIERDGLYLNGFDQNLIFFIKQNRINNIDRHHIYELMAYTNPPQAFLNILELFFNLIHIEKREPSFKKMQQRDKFRYFNGCYHQFKNYKIYDVDCYFYIEESKYPLIEECLSTYSLEMVKMISQVLTRAYLNIQINYLISKNNIDEFTYRNIIKKMKLLEKNCVQPYQRINNNLQNFKSRKETSQINNNQ